MLRFELLFSRTEESGWGLAEESWQTLFLRTSTGSANLRRASCLADNRPFSLSRRCSGRVSMLFYPCTWIAWNHPHRTSSFSLIVHLSRASFWNDRIRFLRENAIV